MAKQNQGIRVTSVSPISPQNEAVYEVGKKMLADSLEIGREFSKFMVSVSTGAIPIYVVLVELLKVHDLPVLIYALAPTLFLISTILFTLSYFPKHGKYSLDIIDEIEEAIKKALTSRNLFLYSGIIIFLIGIVVTIGVSAGFAETASPIQARTVIETVLVPQNSSSADYDLKLDELEVNINEYTVVGDISYREYRAKDGTLIVATFQGIPK